MADLTLEDALEELYAVTPDRFVDVRGELVERLRENDRPEEAEELKDRRKPTLAAWAVNQAVRDRPGEADRLWAAADRLREATSDEESTRDALGELRQSRRSLRDAATDALRQVGTDPDNHLENVTQTLTTAAVVPDQRAEVASGWLVRPLTASGFRGALDPDVMARVRDGDEGRSLDRRRQRRLERERQRLERHVERVEGELGDAEELVERRRGQLHDAEQQAEEQRERLDEARGELADVESELESLG